MLSKARIKLIQSLSMKKYRSELKLFVVEGKKQVAELLTSEVNIAFIAGLSDWVKHHGHLIKSNTEILEITSDELKKISLLNAPQEVVAVVKMPEEKPVVLAERGLTLMLDNIQDPGNLGTIIRTADWYGIMQIICSEDCVDVYNPKTLQATMGSFLRVNVSYAELTSILSTSSLPIYGAMLNGKSIYQTQLLPNAILIIGNEGKGISAQVQSFINSPITIPRIGEAESLNAAIAAAILCDNFSRQTCNL